MAQNQPPIPNLGNLSPDLIDPGRELEDQLERHRREEETRRFREGVPDLEPERVSPDSALSKDKKVDDTLCVQVDEIRVEGINLILMNKIDALNQNLTPGCLKRSDIAELMKGVDKTYIDKGYITTRTYIPAQNIKDTRVLTLQVIEGVTEDVKHFSKDTYKTGILTNLQLWTAFGSPKNEPLNIRRFEQGLEQLNRLSSVNAKLRLEPGEISGGSVIVVEQEVKDRIRGYVGWGNLGSASTGQREGRIQLAADNLLFLNDTFSFFYVGSTNANAINTALSIPLGYNTLTASVAVSDYLLPLTEISELLGQTETFSLSLDRVVARNATSVWHLSGAVRYRQSDRFINSVQLSPQNTVVGDIRLRRILNTQKARWSWEIGTRVGLPWFNALTDIGSLENDQAHTEFQVVDFSVSRLGKGGRHGRWSVTLSGQAASFALLGSEQLSLGSQSSVRGYKEPVLGGDIGAALQVNGSFPLPRFKFWEEGGSRKGYDWLRQRSSLYVFSDMGGAYSYGLSEARFIHGVGAGYRFFTKRAQFDLGVQTGLANYDGSRLSSGETRVTASVTLKTF